MNMLSIQIGRLREKAEIWQKRGCYEETSALLREAADTIESLRDRLQAETLGSGTLTAEQVRKAIEKRFDFDVWVPAERWQAIADELNVTLESGECEPKWTLQGKTQTQEFWRCGCGNCGECFGVETRESFPFKMTINMVKLPNYCPNCGRKVKQ